MDRHFPYRCDARFAPMWLVAAVRPWHDGVTLTDDDRLIATYGLLKLETSLDNVVDAHVTSGYRWWTAIGPRLSAKDDGLTFGTNRDAGTCIHFRDRVGPVLGLRRHSALTVTVADPTGLADALNQAAASRGAGD